MKFNWRPDGRCCWALWPSPKPTAKKLLAGNQGKPALNKTEPDFELVLNIDCPDWMGDNGRMLWETVASQLCKERILAATDIQNLEVYCSAYDQFRMAQADIAQNGVTVTGAMGGVIKKSGRHSAQRGNDHDGQLWRDAGAGPLKSPEIDGRRQEKAER